MIELCSYSAVFSRPVTGLEGLARVRAVAPASTRRLLSPCAVYAVAAVELLETDLTSTGLVCVSGPTGSTCAAFDRAWQRSADGRLVSAGFGRGRFKHIHPFTLIRSLQNQVPAVLSMSFGMKGPCLNVLESVTALASVLPNIEAMLPRCPRVLLVLAAAGARGEERSKMEFLAPGRMLVEGAICFLFSRTTESGALGQVGPGRIARDLESGKQENPAANPAGPPLSAGVELLRCIAAGLEERQIPLHDFFRCQSAIRWRKS